MINAFDIVNFYKGSFICTLNKKIATNSIFGKSRSPFDTCCDYIYLKSVSRLAVTQNS